MEGLFGQLVLTGTESITLMLTDVHSIPFHFGSVHVGLFTFTSCQLISFILVSGVGVFIYSIRLCNLNMVDHTFST